MKYFWIVLSLILVFALFSIYHAYIFTHAIPAAQSAIQREGMQLTFMQLIKATLIGIHPIKIPIKNTPDLFALPYRDVSFTNEDGDLIKGWNINASKPQARVILLHGYNANKESMLPYAKLFYDNNYSVLMFDFRGAGESSGKYVSAGYFEKNDVISAVEFLKRQGELNNVPLYGLGISEGGAALVFAQTDIKEFDAIIVDSMYSSLHQNIANRVKVVYNLPKYPFATSLTFFGGLVLGVNGFQIAPINYIGQLNTPILIIQGDSDESVSLVEASDLFSSAKEPKFLWIVKKAGHAQSFENEKSGYEQVVFNFLKSIESVDSKY